MTIIYARMERKYRIRRWVAVGCLAWASCLAGMGLGKLADITAAHTAHAEQVAP